MLSTQSKTEECRPFVELHQKETENQDRQLAKLDSLIGEVLEEIGALLPLTGEGCPASEITSRDPGMEDNGIPYNGQLRDLLFAVRRGVETTQGLQSRVSTILVNIRMIHRQLVGERPCDPSSAGCPAPTERMR
jgi:hypothetical protein